MSSGFIRAFGRGMALWGKGMSVECKHRFSKVVGLKMVDCGDSEGCKHDLYYCWERMAASGKGDKCGLHIELGEA